MKEAIEIISRRKWLFIIPFAIVFLVPVVYSFLFMRSYEANSLVWLDSDVSIAPILNEGAGLTDDANPIEQEAKTLQQLLQSRAFIERVIEGTPLKAEMETPVDRVETIAFVRKNLKSETVGPNSLRLTFYGSDADEAVTVARVATEEFLSWVRQAVAQQNTKSTQFFSQKSEGYSQELDDVRVSIQGFMEEHPEAQKLDIQDKVLTAPEISVSPAIQSEFERLKSQETYAQEMYDSSLRDLARIRVLASAQEERITNGLRVVDEPVAPTSFAKKRLLLLDFLALMAAIIVGITAVIVAELADRTFRTEQDVEDELHLPVLVEVGERARRARTP